MRCSLTWVLVLCLLGPAGADDANERDYAVDDTGQLYELRCERAEIRKVGRIEVDGVTPTLWDIAATPDGYVYGISEEALFLINVTEPEKSVRVAAHRVRGGYGMTAVGSVLLVNTRDNQVFVIDRKTGDATAIGAMGGAWGASGDIALVGERIFSSVKDGAGREALVELDPETGAATEVGRFVDQDQRPIEHMYGLICRKGVLYGLTLGGDLLRVDENTGRCVVLRRTGITWYGATDCVRF
jgi:hypothetical protein